MAQGEIMVAFGRILFERITYIPQQLHLPFGLRRPKERDPSHQRLFGVDLWQEEEAAGELFQHLRHADVPLRLSDPLQARPGVFRDGHERASAAQIHTPDARVLCRGGADDQGAKVLF